MQPPERPSNGCGAFESQEERTFLLIQDIGGAVGVTPRKSSSTLTAMSSMNRFVVYCRLTKRGERVDAMNVSSFKKSYLGIYRIQAGKARM